jgi:hypothetical protein
MDKVIPVQALTDPEVSRMLRIQRFQENRDMEVVKLSDLSTSFVYPQNIPGTNFC